MEFTIPILKLIRLIPSIKEVEQPTSFKKEMLCIITNLLTEKIYLISSDEEYDLVLKKSGRKLWFEHSKEFTELIDSLK